MRRKVLLIGIDAGEPSLVEKWMDNGALPTLARLRAEGSYGRLSSPAQWLAGSPWPTFYTGMPPTEHGLYHYLMWDAARMQTVRAGEDALDLRPFWRQLGAHGIRSLVVDVPLAPPPEPFSGVEVNAWATHDRLHDPACEPPELLRWIEKHVGPPPLDDEVHRPLGWGRLLRIRDELLATIQGVTHLATELMRREAWDLAIICYSSTHRGGHKLWLDPKSRNGLVDEDDRDGEFRDALGSIYRAADNAIGRLFEVAGEETTALVFSLHGMGPNSCHTALLPEMLSRVLAGDCGGAELGLSLASRILRRAREFVPLGVRNEAKRRLPRRLQDRLTSYWRTGGRDWSRTRAFCPPADLQGYVRINLQSRESRGIVAQEDYDALCNEIREGVASFVDADSGEPVADAVVRPLDVFPPGERHDRLPDLIVRWAPFPVVRRRAVSSTRFGTIALATPGVPPDGRPGNHRPEGFLVAAGPGFGRSDRLEGARVLDLAPTVYDLFGIPVPSNLTGSPLAAS